MDVCRVCILSPSRLTRRFARMMDRTFAPEEVEQLFHVVEAAMLPRTVPTTPRATKD